MNKNKAKSKKIAALHKKRKKKRMSAKKRHKAKIKKRMKAMKNKRSSLLKSVVRKSGLIMLVLLVIAVILGQNSDRDS